MTAPTARPSPALKPYYEDAAVTFYCGDALTVLRKLPEKSIHCCVTSPPYWGLRDYGTETQIRGGTDDCVHEWDEILRDGQSGGGTEKQRSNTGSYVQQQQQCKNCTAWRGQLGLEPTPERYVRHMVEIFREVRRVLRDDGTLWLNLGDSYFGGGNNHGNGKPLFDKQASNRGATGQVSVRDIPIGCKAKDLCMIPARVALALQADGWYLRQDIIWSKPNPMPESVTDRCTKSHEYIFLLSKSARYYFDQDAIKEPITQSSYARLGQDVESQTGSDRVPGKTNGAMKAVKFGGNNRCPDTRLQSGKAWTPQKGDGGNGFAGHTDSVLADGTTYIDRNKRSVWTVTTQPFKAAHFATFPPKLIEPCILAGCPSGGVVLDPFTGAGTTALVAQELGRKCIGIELNESYLKLAIGRIAQGVLALDCEAAS